VKKCLCIPHLLKALVFVVQHQTEIDGLTPYAADRRLKMLVQAFRLALGVLSSRREPWVTYKHSPAEANRLYTVLTAISVEFPLPNEEMIQAKRLTVRYLSMFSDRSNYFLIEIFSPVSFGIYFAWIWILGLSRMALLTVCD
jgi:hypothetical protein